MLVANLTNVFNEMFVSQCDVAAIFIHLYLNTEKVIKQLQTTNNSFLNFNTLLHELFEELSLKYYQPPVLKSFFSQKQNKTTIYYWTITSL